MATKKKIILCDTNIIIELFKNNPLIISALNNVGNESIYLSSITVAEPYYGALNKAELTKINKKLDTLSHIPILEPISDTFEALMKEYSLSHKISIPDAIIAATALYFEIELFTLNTRDFKFIKNLKFYQP